MGFLFGDSFEVKELSNVRCERQKEHVDMLEKRGKTY